MKSGVPLFLYLAVGYPVVDSFITSIKSRTWATEARRISQLHSSQSPDDTFGKKGLIIDRRSLLGACIITPVLLPSFIEAAEESEQNFDCLLDLPPLSETDVRIYLCRHGQTENNRLRKVQGARVDPPINGNGTHQASSLGKALSRANPKPQVFFSSKLQRAKMTAQLAAKEVDPSIEPLELAVLSEVDFGPLAEGKPLSLAKAGMEATYAAWAIGNIDYRPSDGGDSGRDILARATESLRELELQARESSNGCVAAVTHSTFLRILLGMVLDEPLIESASRKVVNGGVTVIDIPRDLSARVLGRKPKLLGGMFSQVPGDYRLEIPICKVVRVNEDRHLPIV